MDIGTSQPSSNHGRSEVMVLSRRVETSPEMEGFLDWARDSGDIIPFDTVKYGVPAVHVLNEKELSNLNQSLEPDVIEEVNYKLKTEVGSLWLPILDVAQNGIRIKRGRHKSRQVILDMTSETALAQERINVEAAILSKTSIQEWSKMLTKYRQGIVLGKLVVGKYPDSDSVAISQELTRRSADWGGSLPDTVSLAPALW